MFNQIFVSHFSWIDPSSHLCSKKHFWDVNPHGVSQSQPPGRVWSLPCAWCDFLHGGRRSFPTAATGSLGQGQAGAELCTTAPLMRHLEGPVWGLGPLGSGLQSSILTPVQAPRSLQLGAELCCSPCPCKQALYPQPQVCRHHHLGGLFVPPFSL